MNRPNNLRHQDTEKRIHDALMEFLDRDNAEPPTVKDICGAAAINRSTFYRHYQDICDLMERTEHRIQHGLARELAGLDWAGARPQSPEILVVMLRYIARYRSFYRSYLKTRPADPMEAGFRAVYENHLKPMFRSVGVTDEGHMDYYCRFCRAGLSSVVGAWLEQGCPEPPEEVAGLLSRILNWPAQSL